jgi:L-fuculose-phosphate aldolase
MWASRRRTWHYYMLRFGLGFDEIRADNLLLVDDELNVLEGDGMPNPANRFHLWIYRTRPQVKSIVHTHAPHVSALSTIGVPLVVSIGMKPATVTSVPVSMGKAVEV